MDMRSAFLLFTIIFAHVITPQAIPLASADELHINGFMSVGAGALSNRDITIAGFDDDVSFRPDTMLGLQISKQINATTKATTQLVARGSEDYNTQAAWAYVTLAADEHTDIRLGRLRTPLFYYSDFLEVGYAYNWIRPPSEVYRLNDFSSVEGVDITRHFRSEHWDNSLQFYYGRFKDSFTASELTYQLELKDFTGLVLNLHRQHFGARLSYHQADIYTFDDLGTQGGDLDNLLALAQANNLGDEFTPDGDTTRFYQAALTYEQKDWAFIAEWTALDHDTSLFLADSAWLVSAAKRSGEVTWHVSYTASKDTTESGLTGQLQRNLRSEQSSVILGSRFDFNAGTAVKFELQYNDEKTHLGQDGESGMLYSTAIDLVF